MRTEKQIRATIRNLTSSVATIREVTQRTLIEISAHAQQHGRGTLAEELYLAATGMNQRKLRQWLTQYSCVRLDDAGKATISKAARNGCDGDGDDVIRELTTNAVNWWEIERTTANGEQKPLDVADALKSLAKRVTKAREAGREIKADVAELRAALMALQAVLEASETKPEPARIDTLDGTLIRELRMAA